MENVRLTAFPSLSDDVTVTHRNSSFFVLYIRIKEMYLLYAFGYHKNCIFSGRIHIFNIRNLKQYVVSFFCHSCESLQEFSNDLSTM